MSALEDLFESLRPPVVGGDTRFAVVPIGVGLRHLIAKDQTGYPAILIDAPPKGATLLRIELQHLTVHPDLRCEVEFPEGTATTGSYTLIRCTGDGDLQALFLRLMSGLIAELGPQRDRSDLARTVLRLVDLFRALDAPPKRSIQGLWAELFLIAQARDPIRILEA
jgi:hypothetical protein